MSRVLLVASTTGYQVRSFSDVAKRLGIELVLATDRCHVLDNPWNDGAIPIKFHDENNSIQAIKEAAASRPFDGVLAVGDRPSLIAALAAGELGLKSHPPTAVRTASNKLKTRICLRDAGLPSPWFISIPFDGDIQTLLSRAMFPCVVKPLSMSASRGVIRVETFRDLEKAIERIRALFKKVDVHDNPANGALLIEEYLPGYEVAVEGLLTDGKPEFLAVFDKPNQSDGPFFEETIYVTPSDCSKQDLRRIRQSVISAVIALGLTNGPIHVECRVTPQHVYVLEVAARPIGGLCSRTLRFSKLGQHWLSLEELLLRHAIGKSVSTYRLDDRCSGVMMIPIPSNGLYKSVSGLKVACAIKWVEEIIVTAKRDQWLQTLPEGGSYLGFIFARAAQAKQVVNALCEAHRQLSFEIESSILVL